MSLKLEKEKVHLQSEKAYLSATDTFYFEGETSPFLFWVALYQALLLLSLQLASICIHTSKTTGNCSNPLATKAVTRRFLVQQLISSSYNQKTLGSSTSLRGHGMTFSSNLHIIFTLIELLCSLFGAGLRPPSPKCPTAVFPKSLVTQSLYFYTDSRHYFSKRLPIVQKTWIWKQMTP